MLARLSALIRFAPVSDPYASQLREAQPHRTSFGFRVSQSVSRGTHDPPERGVGVGGRTLDHQEKQETTTQNVALWGSVTG